MKSNTNILQVLLLALLSILLASSNKSSGFLNKSHLQQQEFSGNYLVKSLVQNNNKYTGTLQYDGNLNNYMSDDNQVIKKLEFVIQLNNDNELTLKITPSEVPFFELPQREPFPFEKNSESQTIKDNVYTLELPKVNQAFNFQIKTQSGATVYDSNGSQFVFTQLYVKFGTKVYGEEIWGWGERRGIWGYTSGKYTIWNQDYGRGQMTTGKEGQQTYGTHPMWLQKSDKNQDNKDIQTQYHIVYVRTTYGLLMTYEQNQQIVIEISGGPLELKFFIYENPKENIRAYNKYINGWSLHPFWSSGFHICKWGIQNSGEWKSIWNKANSNGVSFDALWSDIDYLENFQDFTISEKYDVQTMKQVTNTQNPLGVKWVPIIDAGIAQKSDSGAKGNSQNLFIKSSITKKSLIGCVWPGPAYFVDFNNPAAKIFWKDGLKNITDVYHGPQPGGIWLDMNEPSSFTSSVQGEVTNPDECGQLSNTIGENIFKQFAKGFNHKVKQLSEILTKIDRRNLRQVKAKFANDWGYPWSPMGDKALSYHTISTSATHHNGNDAQYVNAPNFTITEYEFHNLYGFLEGVATNEYLQEAGEALPFIITRSSFAGQGKYTQHWTGDNKSEWDQLETAVGDIFNFQLFGIPMTGADVCGFVGNSTAELCARWYQFGAWSPFFRTHSTIYSRDQYPWSFDEPYVLDSSVDSINLRYSFLKWYYAIFVREQPHGTVFRPLFFDYPEDAMAQAEAHQALIGNEIMITPVLKPGDKSTQTTDIKVYFPGEKEQEWYWYSNGQVLNGGDVADFTVPFDAVCPMFIRGGAILAQQPQALQGVTRARLLDNKFRLVIALDKNKKAQGNLLGLGEDYNSEIVKAKCTRGQNCIVVIQSEVVQQSSSSLTLQIQILPEKSTTNYTGEIIVESVWLQGQKLGPLKVEDIKLVFSANQTKFNVEFKI